jgi:uncharacterized protein
VQGEKMNLQTFERARQYALNRLEEELSPSLPYHGMTHTRDEVVPAVELMAHMEGIHAEPLYLLRTAAWFHDLGFIEQPAYHEMIGARIAGQVLPGIGYTPRQVEIVRWAIYATIIPQDPHTILERILCDADLNVLGREDFMRRNGDLRRELANFGKVYSDLDWYTNQDKFIKKHRFYTESARILLCEQKSLNVAALDQVLAGLSAKE